MATLPSPRTWISGDTPSAAMLNTNLRDAYGFLMNPPRVKVYSTSGQPIDIGPPAEEILTWTTEVYDSDGMFNLGSASRLTAVTAGFYELVLHIEWQLLSEADPGNRLAYIKKNANGDPDVDSAGYSAIVGFDSANLMPSNTSVPQTNHVCTSVALNAGDYVEAVAYSTDATTRQTIIAGSARKTFFAARWMSAI